MNKMILPSLMLIFFTAAHAEELSGTVLTSPSHSENTERAEATKETRKSGKKHEIKTVVVNPGKPQRISGIEVRCEMPADKDYEAWVRAGVEKPYGTEKDWQQAWEKAYKLAVEEAAKDFRFNCTFVTDWAEGYTNAIGKKVRIKCR